MPAAYLTREAWLGDFRFYVDERVIIPRSFIAELLPGRPRAVRRRSPTRVASALDLCTGSGCLAILLAHAYPNADVDAVDLSSDALAVAQRNVADYGLAGRINLIRSDLFANLSEKSYDLIISNPPYVDATRDGRRCPPSTGTSRALALAGGEDGLDAVRTIVKRRAALPESRRHCWWSRSATTARRSRRRSRACRSCGSSTAGHDDGVFALTREDRRRPLTRGRSSGPSGRPRAGSACQAEEVADLADQLARGAPDAVARALLGIERLQHRDVRGLALREHLGHRHRDLRAVPSGSRRSRAG